MPSNPAYTAAARRLVAMAHAALPAGCASTYELTLMPRDSDKLCTGVAEDAGDWGGGGVCRDDQGREYDVQIRPAAQK